MQIYAQTRLCLHLFVYTCDRTKTIPKLSDPCNTDSKTVLWVIWSRMGYYALTLRRVIVARVRTTPLPRRKFGCTCRVKDGRPKLPAPPRRRPRKEPSWAAFWEHWAIRAFRRMISSHHPFPLLSSPMRKQRCEVLFFQITELFLNCDI